MMMASPPVTVIDVASGINSTTTTTTSASRASLSLSPPRNRGRDREPLTTTDSGDDMEPLLLSSSNVAGVSGTTGQTRRSRVPRCLLRIRQSRLVAALIAIFSFSGGVTWIVRGICICVGMMLMGGVGSFTLHQMMSPQIESLLRQRNEMQQDIEELRNQVANMRRVAATRLEMIHLLEKELEKQVVSAAADAAAATRGQYGNTVGGGGDNGLQRTRHFNPHAVQSNFWTTLVYAALLGSLVLAVVGFRIYQIARAETQRTQKSRASSDFGVSSTRTGPSGAPNGLLASAATNDTTTTSDDATSTAATTQLYKRAPGNAPGDRLVHV